jgi:hypothetical protein
MRLSIREVLSEAWALYTRHAGKLIVIAAVVFAILSLLPAAIGQSDDLDLGGAIAIVAVSALVNTVGIALLQGALAVAVSELRAGRDVGPILDVFAKAQSRLWPLLGAIVLVTIVVVGGFILLFIPGLVALTFTMAVVPVVVLEGCGVRAAFRRSFALVRGDGFAVFAIIVLTQIFAAIIASVIQALLSPLPRFFDIYLGWVVANAIVVPLVALAWTITYFDLKLNKG